MQESKKQAAFEAADLKFSASVAAGKGKKSSTVLKKELASFVNENVVEYLNFMQKLDSGRYDDFAKEVALEIREANQAASKVEKAKK